MSETAQSFGPSIARLILIPSLISLAVTILRLSGELCHWSEKWFSTATSGVLPSGSSWVIGITWLAIPFGGYFALKLAAAGKTPLSEGKAAAYGVLGVAFLLGSSFALPHIPLGFPKILIFIWLFMALPAAVQFHAWPDLSKTLLIYGVAARTPVVIVMYLAMAGSWGTHYDYVGIRQALNMPLWPRFLWLAFFPQLIFWVGFTILIGSLSGSVAAFLVRRIPR